MIDNKYFSIDLIRPYIMINHGGLYTDTDFYLIRSPKFLHTAMDLYTGLEMPRWTGLGPGVVAARKGHPAGYIWLQFIRELYGYGEPVYGVLDLIPMPLFWLDQFGIVGPRAFTFAVWAALDKETNNDSMFKESMINFLPEFGCYTMAKDDGHFDPWEGNETISIGGEIMHFERFGHQMYEGSWIMKD